MAADKKTLRDWCSEGCFSFLSARIDDREAQGLKFDSKILDIRNVELLLAKVWPASTTRQQRKNNKK